MSAQEVLEELAQRVGVRLLAEGAMLATAESCTGGWVAQAVTAVSGSSAWFDRGFVTYSNQSKQEMLGVASLILKKHGAVSEPVARAMAQGAIEHSAAQWSVSITGIAGPTGGTLEKPVGMVCFAWARTGGGCIARTHYFEGDREAVRYQSVVFALEGLLEQLVALG